MPNCFHLVRKGTTEAALLIKIDEEICELLGVPVHPKFWCLEWFDIIGFGIATGKSLGSQELRNFVASFIMTDEGPERLLKILTYLEENYTSNAWVEIGKSNGS